MKRLEIWSEVFVIIYPQRVFLFKVIGGKEKEWALLFVQYQGVVGIDTTTL